MDLNAIEILDRHPLLDLIHSLGGWDALGNWNRSAWDLNGMVQQCQGRFSLSVFFSISVISDPTRLEHNILMVSNHFHIISIRL